MLKDLFRSIWCTPLKSCWKIYLRSKYGNGGLYSNMAFCSSCRKVKNCCFSLVLDQHTCGNWIITPEYGQWERRETSTKRVAKKIQVWAELLMSGICEDTLQCINYPKMTFKYTSSWHGKNKMFFMFERAKLIKRKYGFNGLLSTWSREIIESKCPFSRARESIFL